MNQNQQNIAQQYQSGLMSTPAVEDWFGSYVQAAVQAMADAIDKEALDRIYGHVDRHAALLATLPEEARPATRRLLDAAFGTGSTWIGIDYGAGTARAGQTYDPRPIR